MAQKWEVVAFKIGTPTTSLYANGNMQVPVNVWIKAIVADNSYQLSQAELDSIALVNYSNMQEELSSPWSYSPHENEFAHNLDLSPPSGISQQIPDAQLKRYWVSTTNIEDIRIAARIRQPDNTVITTVSNDFNSEITLHAQAPISYTIDQNIKITKEKTEEGLWGHETFVWTWWGENYYISSNRLPFVKGTISNYDSTGGGNGYQHHNGLINSYAVHHPDNILTLFYMWDYGAQASKTVGAYVDHSFWGTWRMEAKANITVNKHANSLCLSCVSFKSDGALTGSGWVYSATFTLYDTHGNVGKFKAGASTDQKSIEITDN